MSTASIRLDDLHLHAAEWRAPDSLLRTERLSVFRNSEAASAALFFVYAFLLLACYYQLRLLREPLLLTDGSAELKSYAQAAIAATLMLLVPAYAALFRRTTPARLVQLVTGIGVAMLLGFYALGMAGLDIGFGYYVWVGVFGVTMVAQFWAHAAHSFDIASGQRLFPIVMGGATTGGLVGAAIAPSLFTTLGPWNLLLLAAALLAVTIPLVDATTRAVPSASRRRHSEQNIERGVERSGFGLVLRDPYLAAIAVLVVLLNCVNTTGEYLLTELVLRQADARLAANATLDRGALIARFYGDFYFTVNAVTVVLQALLVGRAFRWLGVSGTLAVLPAVALLGYGLLAALPAFALIHLVKIAENGFNYSFMNTARHALFLPLPAAHQFQGKTAVDGFFWRIGDLAQASIVYFGLHWLGFGIEQFAALNASLALAWLALTVRVARRYRRYAAGMPRVPPRRAGRVAAAALGIAAATAASPTAAAPSIPAHDPLFAADAPLVLDLTIDRGSLCANPQRAGCEDARGTLLYRADDGTAVPIAVRVRSRGRWRKETGACALPALFVFFDVESATATPFAGEPMLPLTTHCRDRTDYEQYVLKEFLAYRLYALLTDESLHVRLAKITYRDAANPERDTTRFAFFTEHFESLARRRGARVSDAAVLDFGRADAQKLATLALFEYLIGNTDWSAVYGHNTVALQDTSGTLSVVPYDFDFSGLVESDYAVPAAELAIRNVRQRVFRGFCTPAPDWPALFAAFRERRRDMAALAAAIPGLESAHRERAAAYIESFFEQLDSPGGDARIVAACRSRSNSPTPPRPR